MYLRSVESTTKAIKHNGKFNWLRKKILTRAQISLNDSRRAEQKHLNWIASSPLYLIKLFLHFYFSLVLLLLLSVLEDDQYKGVVRCYEHLPKS